MKISVICPTYNRHKMLKNAIKSFQSQKYKNKELIVVNDGGDDPFKHIPLGVKLINCVENKGVATAINTGIKESNGALITLLHDDDEFYDNLSLDWRAKPFKLNDCIEFAYSSVLTKCSTFKTKIYKASNVDLLRLLNEEYIHGGGMIWRKDIHNRIGYLEEKYLSYEDYDWKVRCLLQCNCMPIKEKTYRYNMHQKQKHFKNAKNGIYEKEKKLLNEKLQKIFEGALKW